MIERFQIRFGRTNFFHRLWSQMRRMPGLELDEERSWSSSKLYLLVMVIVK